MKSFHLTGTRGKLLDLFGFMAGKEKRALLYSLMAQICPDCAVFLENHRAGQVVAKIGSRLWGLGFGLGAAAFTLLAIHCSNKGPLSCTLDGEVSFGKGHGPFWTVQGSHEATSREKVPIQSVQALRMKKV